MESLPPSAVFLRIQKIAAQTFRCSESAVGSGTTALHIENWDSLTHTLFLMEIEREFSIRFDVVQILRVETIGDLVSEVERLSP